MKNMPNICILIFALANLAAFTILVIKGHNYAAALPALAFMSFGVITK